MYASTPQQHIKISVIMVDGGFRENVFAAEYFSKQSLPENEYEIIWVDYYDAPHPNLAQHPKVKVICLDRTGVYHSSYCFNRGISEAKAEVVVVPDADLIVDEYFLERVWEQHQSYEELALYGYRYDEVEQGSLDSFDFAELQRKCVFKNPSNYGACLSVRKKWLLQINGYEQHPLFQTGNHANGFDIYTRFKNLGLAVKWDRNLKLYHPWHFFTLEFAAEHAAQLKLIEWRKHNLHTYAIEGIDASRNVPLPLSMQELFDVELDKLAVLREK